jgi:hypothetical protein
MSTYRIGYACIVVYLASLWPTCVARIKLHVSHTYVPLSSLLLVASNASLSTKHIRPVIVYRLIVYIDHRTVKQHACPPVPFLCVSERVAAEPSVHACTHDARTLQGKQEQELKDRRCMVGGLPLKQSIGSIGSWGITSHHLVCFAL